MGLLDLLQQGYQNYKQSDTPVATLLRNEPKNFIPSVTRNLEQQLSLLQTPEGALDLVNPVSKIGGLLGSINMGNKSFSQFSPKAVMAFKQANEIPIPKRISSRQIPDEIIKQRNAAIDGTITNSEYYAKQNKLYPFTYFKEVPELTNVFDIGKALKHSKKEAIKGQTKGGRAILGLGASIDNGTKVSSRLDIDAYNTYNVWSASIRGATKEGKNTTVYGQAAHLISKGKDKVKLKGSAQKSLKIAEGGAKSPFAVMDGYWKANSPETIRELAVKYMDNPEWVQVAFNPTKSGHFMDKIKGIPVTEADEVIQIGPLVLGKNVKYDLNLQPFSK
tara:strand:- start:1521 stop:2519 length:999 start_codon:yes stop_codon:yes gene_type:complete